MARTGVDLQGQISPFSPEDLSKIRAPTLVIWGAADRVIPVDHAEFALHAIPDCRAVVLNKAGHGPQIDRPEVFNELVLGFTASGRLAQEDHGGRALIRL
jgi:pimeloyl-ACP methyl ester carboxylesterase